MAWMSNWAHSAAIARDSSLMPPFAAVYGVNRLIEGFELEMGPPLLATSLAAALVDRRAGRRIARVNRRTPIEHRVGERPPAVVGQWAEHGVLVDQVAGAREIAPVEDKEYGWRVGRVVDPFGHHWEIGRPFAE